MSFILSFDIISVVVFGVEGQPDPKIFFLCIPACVADAAAILLIV